MKKLKISKIWIAVVVIVIVAVAAWAMSGGKKEEDINFKEEKVALKTLQNSVTATGTIEAVTSVTVGTQVSGIVNKLYVDYNSQVKKGQVIAELDKTNLLSELNTAKANLASAQSSLNYQAAIWSATKPFTRKDLSAPMNTRMPFSPIARLRSRLPLPRKTYRERKPTSAMLPSLLLSMVP